MSPPGRPEGHYRSAPHAGTPVGAPLRGSPRQGWKLVLSLALAVAASAALLHFWRSPAPSAPVKTSEALASRDAGAAISGRVMLSPALQSRVKPDDTVLIVARVLDGPRQPVAVLKRRAGDLPLDFKLDDSAATTPTLRLSPSTQLLVAARILRAGQATAEPGDLLGSAGPVPVGSHGVLIEISGPAP